MADPFTTALLAVIAQSAEPMVLSDPHLPDGPIIAANDAFLTLTGYERAEIVGRNCRFLQGPGTDKESARRIRGSVAAGQGCVEWIVNHRKDGAAFWNLLFISPVFAPDGALRYFFGNQCDITTGPPAWLDEFQLGPAHMPSTAQAEFHAILAAVAADRPDQRADVAVQARALERVTQGARRLSTLSTQLAPNGN